MRSGAFDTVWPSAKILDVICRPSCGGEFFTARLRNCDQSHDHRLACALYSDKHTCKKNKKVEWCRSDLAGISAGHSEDWSRHCP